MKRILMVVAVVTFVMLSVHLNVQKAYAYENYGVSTKEPEQREADKSGISLFGLEPPSKSLIYGNNQYVSLAGNAENSWLYSDYCFNKVYKITLMVTNDANTDLTVKLYTFGWDTPALVSTKTISANSAKTVYFENLNEDKYYYLAFGYPSDFSAKAVGFQLAESWK